MLFGPPGSFQSPLLSSLVLRLRRDRIILRGKTEFAVLLPSNLSVECVYCTLCNHIFTPSVPYVCGSERKSKNCSGHYYLKKSFSYSWLHGPKRALYAPSQITLLLLRIIAHAGVLVSSCHFF